MGENDIELYLKNKGDLYWIREDPDIFGILPKIGEQDTDTPPKGRGVLKRPANTPPGMEAKRHNGRLSPTQKITNIVKEDDKNDDDNLIDNESNDQDECDEDSIMSSSPGAHN